MAQGHTGAAFGDRGSSRGWGRQLCGTRQWVIPGFLEDAIGLFE